MGVNKSKMRREKKAGPKQAPPPPAPKRGREELIIRLITVLAPALLACYFIWDLGRQ